jgi:hypothetical protein
MNLRSRLTGAHSRDGELTDAAGGTCTGLVQDLLQRRALPGSFADLSVRNVEAAADDHARRPPLVNLKLTFNITPGAAMR